VPPPEAPADPWRGDTQARDYRDDIGSATLEYMRILSWVLTVLFVLVLAQTVFLFSSWLPAVAAADEGTGLAAFGEGVGGAFCFLMLTLMLWCFARSARESARERSATPARWHQGAAR
jgi:hypothetical protein